MRTGRLGGGLAMALCSALALGGHASAATGQDQGPRPAGDAVAIAGSQAVAVGAGRYRDVCQLLPPARAAHLVGFAVDDPSEKLRGQEVAGNITATGWLPGAGLCMYSGVAAPGAGAPIALVVGVASTASLRAATGDEELNAARRFAAIRDALTAGSSNKRRDKAPAHRPASYRITPVRGVGEGAFAATSADALEVIAHQDGFIVEVWYRLPGDPCSSSTTPTCPALDTIVVPAAADLLAGLASSRPIAGSPPKPFDAAPVSFEIGGKTRDVCGLVRARRVGDAAGFAVTTTAPSEHPAYDEPHSVVDAAGGVSTITARRPALRWCAYRAGDHAFSGEIDVKVTTSDMLASVDPNQNARSQLDGTRADARAIAERAASGVSGSARPKSIKKLGEDAFTDQIISPRVTFVQGDTYVEVTRSYGPLGLVTARAARHDLRTLEQVARIIASRLPPTSGTSDSS